MQAKILSQNLLASLPSASNKKMMNRFRIVNGTQKLKLADHTTAKLFRQSQNQLFKTPLLVPESDKLKIFNTQVTMPNEKYPRNL